MHKVITAVALAAFLTIDAHGEIAPAKKALIEELIAVSRADELGAEFMMQRILLEASEPVDSAQVDKARRELASGDLGKKIVSNAFLELYDKSMTEDQLRKAIAFFKTDAGKQYAAIQLQLATQGRTNLATVIEGRLTEEAESSKRLRTMADIRTIATASEAYAVDNNVYPATKDIKELGRILAPTYIRTPPTVDGWGKPLAYVVSSDMANYRFVSGGEDGRIEPANLKIKSTPSPASDDIVFENGVFLKTAGLGAGAS